MRSKTAFLTGLLILGIEALSSGEAFDQFTVEKTKGDSCQIRNKGESSWAAAKEGGVHTAGSAGKTGGGSVITLAFDAKNRFRILPKTEVVISSSTKDAKFRKVISVAMSDGEVEAELDELPSDYEFKVQTPTAVCGAVGTRFSVNTDGGRRNTFSTDKGSTYAASREDGSFYASSIKAGQTLEADVAPGKENSYTQLKVEGGKMPVAFGSRSKTLEVSGGSVVSAAQAKTDSTDEVALKVNKGSVGGEGAGRYIVRGGKVEDVSGDDRSGMVDDYVQLAEEEGSLKAKLARAKARGASESEIERLENDLDQAADDATAARKKLFQYRETIRRTVRDAAEAIRNRPTQKPSY
jgi:hypothetical protein